MAQFFFEPVPHTEAAKLIADKPVVVRRVFDEMLPEIKGRVFTITGLEDATVMQTVRDRIAELPQGADWNKLKHEIVNDISPFIDDSNATEAENQAAAEARAELLLRVHGFQAYSATNERLLQAQRDVFPFCEYVTVGDDHVRQSHAALDGLIVPTNSPFWDKHTPPWGYGCRCQKVGRTAADVGQIQKAQAKLPPEQHTVVTGAALQKLQQGTVLRQVEIGGQKITQSFNVDPRNDQGAFLSTPADLRLPLAEIKARYDADIFAQFEATMKKERIELRTANGEPRTVSVWEWLGGSTRPPGAWPSLDDLVKVQDLGGSTGAELMRDKDTANLYVLKRGNSAQHLRSEAQADDVYRAAGVNVPKLAVLETPTGPVKVAEYIDGTPLKTYLKTASNADRAAALGQLQQNFVLDATLGNYDVIGLDLDNVIVDKKGIAWRIDNGGALLYRAQGALKTDFTGTVTQLDSMRDPKINPAAAKIFGPLSDAQIQEQITAVLAKRDTILAAITDPVVQRTMEARFNDLASRIKSEESLANAVTPEFAKAVEKSRIVGRTLRGDRGDIEDTQILFWGEKTAADKPVTRAKLKLTPDGAAKVLDKIRDSLPAAKPGAPDLVLKEDKFWGKIQAALQTVGHHAGDGLYNAAKLAELKTVKAQLLALKDTGNVGALKHQYLDILDAIETAVAAKTKTAMFAQFKKAPPKMKAETPRPLAIEREEISYFAKLNERGFARQRDEKVWENGSQFVIKLPGDVELKFVPFTEPSGADFNAPYSFRGYIEASVPGAANAQSLQKITDQLRAVGVDTTPVTKEYTELLYLRKNFALRPDAVSLTDVDKIFKNDSLTDAAKITELKELALEKLGILLPDKPTKDYNPAGHANSYGDGWVRTERWDLPVSKLKKELKDYALLHHSRAALPDLIDSLLNGGGDFTSTTERLRKGIPITAGMSPEQDLNTGGANYLFTRLRKTSTPTAGLAFKPELLARQDVISYDADYFGDVTNAAQIAARRAKTVEDLKRYALSSSNETILKWGVNILDDLQFINANTEAERRAIVAVFQKHGYTTLPDGRTIEAIIKVKGKKA